MVRLLPPVLLTLILSACVTGRPPPCQPPSASNVVTVIADGWHTDISLPVSKLGPRLGAFRTLYPGARYLMFGYGKRSFFVAPTQTWRDYLLSVVPGPAAIQITGLNAPPTDAYGPEHTRVLMLTPEGIHALTDYIWNDLAKRPDGAPLPPVARNNNPAGLFFAARSKYDLNHTCNSWTEDALRVGGLPMPGNVMTSDELMARVDPLAARQCRNR